MPSNGPLTNIILTINNTNNTNNDGTFGTRNLRNVYRGRNRFTRQRSINRIYRRRVRRVRPNVSNNNILYGVVFVNARSDDNDVTQSIVRFNRFMVIIIMLINIIRI
uniref:Uncharacterized protein n=1 Tax=Rhizophagus irregularis (strain DAOM 181602 / DAOM 197198 / MUCL 43194) TaxID=747089 RepID=U9SKR1_RHIID